MEPETNRRTSRLLGVFVVLTALALNFTSIGFFLADDHTIENERIRQASMALQGVMGLFGLALLIGWKVKLWAPVRAMMLGFLPVVIGLGFSLWQYTEKSHAEAEQRQLRLEAQANAYASDMNLAKAADIDPPETPR